ncbi:NAD(P)-dependent alcohol dehydrogenase [Aquipuribacter nitratireducens]|uniref:NAD(P)-dependent alcohol dehydrogenase n=1 Tax=Aquipuribacter nitratireducens TaxID=650104 RepID=A0ABW0GLU1_9MICO
MKAVVQDRYGPAEEVLRLADVPDPVVGPHDVVVRVRATSLNAADWHLSEGVPLFVRAGEGVRAPRRRCPGSDVAGAVEAVGAAVTRVRPGDEVVAWADGGGLAELVVARQDDVVLRPGTLDPVEASALPLAGTTALQAVRHGGPLRAGDRVLVTGASGGVGAFAVQLAVAAGARVTASCRTDNVALARSLGAERVLDRTTDPVPDGGPYERIVHVAGPTSVLAMRRALSPDGRLVLVSGDGGRLLGPLPVMLSAAAASLGSSRHLGFLVARTTREDVETLVDEAATGSLRVVVDRTYDLSEAAAALAHVRSGRARGKVVVTV